jgi:hypothetical protein
MVTSFAAARQTTLHEGRQATKYGATSTAAEQTFFCTFSQQNVKSVCPKYYC